MIALFVASFLQAGTAGQVYTTGLRDKLQIQSQFGNCSSKKGAIDISKLTHLKEKRVVITVNRRSTHASIANGLLVVESNPRKTYKLKNFVKSRYSVIANFELVRLGAENMVYWREIGTSQVQRLGLIRIDGRGLHALCTGSIGIESQQ